MERASHIKKVLSTFFAFVLTVTLAILATLTFDESVAFAASDPDPSVFTWTEVSDATTLQDAVSSASSNAYIKLVGNITLSDELTLEGGSGAGVHLHLDLNGYTLSRGLSSSSSSSGSVIYMERDSQLWIYDTSDAQTGVITGGYQSNSGGGIHAERGNRIYLYSGSISDNKATAGFGANGGGGVYLHNGSIMYMYGGTISNNTVEKYFGGGGVYCDEDTEFYMYGGTISGNKTLSYNNAFGGGIYVNKATFSMSDGTITENTSKSGGGICFYEVTSATITGGTISNNGSVGIADTVDPELYGKYYYGQGGGIYSIESSLSISNAYITGNYCEYNSSNATGSPSFGTAGEGGGIYHYGESLTISNTYIANNTAAYEGGGACLSSDTSTITGCTFYSNTAAHAGGLAAYLSTIKDCTFEENKATEGVGGAMYASDSTLINTTIKNNSAATTGGGVYGNPAYPTTIESATITGNTSGESGSGVYSLGTCTIKNITVTDNTCNSSTKPGGAFCVAYPVFNVQSDSVINISGNKNGDYVRNTDSGDTSDKTCAAFNGYYDTASVNVALTLSTGETYQKLINMGNPSQASWFSVSDSSSYYMAVESTYWVWVFNNYQTGTGVAIEGVEITNDDGTVTASTTEGAFDSGNEWDVEGIFSEADRAALNVTITYVITSYTSTSGKGTATTYTETKEAVDFTAGTQTYTYTTGSGSNTATATARISVAAYDGSTGITSWGGALRLDSAATTDSSGTTTYSTDTANLRHGYCFNLPSGATSVSFGWNYGTTSGSYSGSLTGTNSRAAGSLSGDKSSTGTVANIVFTNVPSAYYASKIYSQMYVTYTASDGSSVTLKGDEVGIAVDDVVSSILATDSGASATEIAYAEALQDA